MTLLSNRLYLAGLFLLPIAAFASAIVPFFSLKVLLGFVVVGGAAALAIVGALKQRSLPTPGSWLLLSVWLLPLAYAVSAVFAPVWKLSVFGSQLDTDTVLFVSILALTATLPLFIFHSRADFVRGFFAVLAAAWFVAAFQVLRLFFGPEMLSFGVFTSPLFSLVGKWNDLSIFFGFVATLSLITLEALPLSGKNKTIVGVTLAIALFFVALVNYTPAWVALGVLALGIVLYRLLLARKGTTGFSALSIVVLILAICCTLFAGSVGTTLGSYFGTGQIEARPSFASTIAVASQTLSKSPWFGSGPNTFLSQWDLYRPQELNQSIFWNADFTSGVGFIPTALVTVGGVGAAAWVLFLILFFVAGIRALIIRQSSDPVQYYLTLASFAAGAYVLVMASIYLPSPVILMIGFAAIGMFMALEYRQRHADTPRISFQERPRLGFIAVLVMTLILIFGAVSVYGVGSVFASSVYYEKALAGARDQATFDAALKDIGTAMTLSSDDRLYRLATLIHLSRLNTVVANASNRKTEDVQRDFQAELGAAVENGLAAVRYNQLDYRNWQTVASAYQSVVPLGIKGAYESAVASYDKAVALNAKTPVIPYSRAQLELAHGSQKAARTNIDASLSLKQDYVPAILLLAQIELANGNLSEAIKQAEAAAVFEPSSPIIRFQIGVLKFENKDYKGAGEAFQTAIQLAPDYANAHYYLGRVYIQTGDTAKAIESFTVVDKLNPNNADVQDIIAALKAGKNPFAPPAPEKKGK